MEQTTSNEKLSPVQEFYKGRSIFITGATGLVGKVLVEKLLRCCPGIGKLYLLMRPKKGLSPEERINKFIKNELFSCLKEKMPSFKENIVSVYGDLVLPKLGISDEDMEMMKANVSVVIHSAARIRLKEPISVATKHNLIGTKYIVELCRNLPKITALVHVSTTYAHREPDYTVPEKVTTCKITPKQLIDAVGWMDDDTLDKATEPFVKEKVCTYCLTKALAENVVADNSGGDIPSVIVRLGVVCSTWKEPVPGWCDTIQGLSGFSLAVGKGFVRTLLITQGAKIDLIPVDVVANTIIATAWYRSTNVLNDCLVVNCAMDYEKLLTVDNDFLKDTLKFSYEYPTTQMYRYPDLTLYHSWFLYKIHALIDHYIPAFFCDLIIYAFTGKTLMMPLYKGIEKVLGVYAELQNKPRIIVLENYKRIMGSLSTRDSEMFFMNMDDLSWSEYIELAIKGGRKYLSHEDPETIPYAKRKAKIWWFVTTVLKWIIILSFGYFIISKFQMFDALDDYY